MGLWQKGQWQDKQSKTPAPSPEAMLNTPRAHLLEQREFFFESAVDSAQGDLGQQHRGGAESAAAAAAAAAPPEGLPTLLRAASLEELATQPELPPGGKAVGVDWVKEAEVVVPCQNEPEVAVPDKPGRVAIAEHEGIMGFNISKCSTPSMDAFMRENAAGLVLQGFETIVPSDDDPSVSYAYIEPRRFGPHRAQLRITTKVIFAPGQVEIQILDMTLGLADRRTGEIDFEGQALKLLFKTENTITWREDEQGGIDVVNRSWSRSETRLPWWFPMPDSAMQRMITFFVRQVVANGQKQTNAKLQAKFHEWVSQREE